MLNNISVHFKNVLFVVSLIFFILLPSSSFAGARTVKVGVYDNYPIVFQDKNGEFSGLSVDVLKYIAEKENWNIEYVFGSWHECIKRLDHGEIDVQVYIAYSKERALKYDYTQEALLSNWGVVYTWPGSGIETILDLQGKRVALMKESIHPTAFKQLINTFDIKVEIIDIDNHTDGFKLVRDKKVDAIVVNRIFGLSNAKQFNVEKTNIIFNPIEIRYAMPKGENADLIITIDKYLKELKADKQSIFYQSFNSAFGLDVSTFLIPKWIYWIVALIFIASGILLLLNMGLTRIVKNRTQELQDEITEHKQVEEALRIESNKLKSIFEAMDDGIYIVNQDYDIQYVNPALIKTFGIYEDRKCYEYFHERTEACPWCKNPEVFAGKTVHWEWYLSKNQRTYDLIDTPLYNTDGTISKLAIFHDITERKQTEEDLEKHRLHLEEMVKERTDKLQNVVDLMAGREVRMADLKKQVKSLQVQLAEAGL